MLNDSRTMPYDFCIFLFDGLVYLVDKSEITYPCSTRPHYWCEPVYWESSHLNDLGEELPDPCYILESDVSEDEISPRRLKAVGTEIASPSANGLSCGRPSGALSPVYRL